MSIVSLRDGSGREQLWRRPDFTSPRRTRDIGPPGEPSIEARFALWPGGWFEMTPHAGTPGLLDERETMLHGEHPVFARADYAAARIEPRALRARVLDQPEPEAASVLPGEFRWPHAGDHRHALIWRYHQPPSAPEPRDIWALEPWSFGGVNITEAIGHTDRLAPGGTVAYSSRVAVS
jgi:hypothetical protein